MVTIKVTVTVTVRARFAGQGWGYSPLRSDRVSFRVRLRIGLDDERSRSG